MFPARKGIRMKFKRMKTEVRDALQKDSYFEAILSELDIEALAIAKIGTAADTSLEFPFASVDLLHKQLYPSDIEVQISNTLKTLDGHCYLRAAMNQRLVKKLNQIVRGAGFVLTYGDSKEVINLRFIDPPRAKTGYFQLRTADRVQKAIYTGAKFPALKLQRSE
jgi:hypothetical protein